MAKGQQENRSSKTSVAINAMRWAASHQIVTCDGALEQTSKKGIEIMLEHESKEKSDGNDKNVRYKDNGGEEVLGNKAAILMILKHLIGDRKENNNEESDDEVDQEKRQPPRSKIRLIHN